MTENYLLEVKNVSKSFGVVKALNRIDFNVRPNEIHALCGENGAGKSTLMNMDCVLHDKTPQAGDAFETTFNNGACDVTAFLIAPEVIDKDNYQAALFDSGYYSEDQLK